MTQPLHALSTALGDQYRVERELGRGGMAAVYLARDLKHDRDVALKVLHHELGADGNARFLQEVRIVARLNHPHILPLHDSGIAGGLPYFVMPYMRGETLRQVLDRRGRLPVDEAVELVRRVAYAAGYAHAQGVIHRDIKPDNILLQEGEPILADFGIALGADLRQTQAGIALGTPLYMSPEQAMGTDDLDPRSDVYALGCVLFELLAGAPPFTASSLMGLLVQRLEGGVPSVRSAQPDVPPGLEAVLQRALAPDRASRFATMAAFAEALTAPGAVRPRVPVVAVLPFRSIGTDADAVSFAEGIGEDVIAHLAKLRTLDVIGPTSVAPYRGLNRRVRDIAASLGAGAVLDGSVRRAGARVRVVAQLVDGATEQQIWAETYDRDLTDIFAIQTDVALKIAEALRAALTPEERTRVAQVPTHDVDAYGRFLLGRQQLARWTRTGMQEGLRLLEEATARDPGFALAHAMTAFALSEILQNDEADADDVYRQAMQAAERALALDPALATAHSVIGHLRAIHDFDWAAAEDSFKRAVALEPGNADAWDLYGRFCYALRRFDEAVAMVRRAHALDPVAHRSDLPTALLRAGRFAEAAEAARSIVAADPTHDRGHMTLAWALIGLGRPEEGLASAREAIRLAPDRLHWIGQYAQALGLAGHEAEAREQLARLTEAARTQPVSPYVFAFAHVGLGEHELAMDALEEAFARRSGSIHSIAGSFLLEPLRAHPRFAALLQRMHIPAS